MKNNKQINDKDLKDISGGNSLEQLLSELGEKDKKSTLVDYGDGSELKIDSGFECDESSKLIVVKREKDGA